MAFRTFKCSCACVRIAPLRAEHVLWGNLPLDMARLPPYNKSRKTEFCICHRVENVSAFDHASLGL